MFSIVLLVGFGMTSPTVAQEPGSIFAGAHAAYNFNDLDAEAVGINALITVPARMSVNPSATWYILSSSSTYWMLTATLRWSPIQKRIRPYLGAGPYWSNFASGSSTNSAIGVLAQLGAEYTLPSLHSFLELHVMKDQAVSSEFATGLRVRLRGARQR